MGDKVGDKMTSARLVRAHQPADTKRSEITKTVLDHVSKLSGRTQFRKL